MQNLRVHPQITPHILLNANSHLLYLHLCMQVLVGSKKILSQCFNSLVAITTYTIKNTLLR